MALKTLEEINREFMTNSPAREQKISFEPITPFAIGFEPIKPRAIEVKLPVLMPHPIVEGRDPDASEKSDKQSGRSRQKKRRGVLTTISDVLFSLTIITILVFILNSGSSNRGPKTFFGHSYFSVQTSSMQDEIPKGSFILVKHTDPRALEVGDNITFMHDKTTSWTHKIDGIIEDDNNSGTRAFRTRGVNNANADKDVVKEDDVVGKVVLVIPKLGAILMKLGQNIILIFIIFSLCILLTLAARGLLAKRMRAPTGDTINS